MDRPERKMQNAWHNALNRFHEKSGPPHGEFRSWMYEAKSMADEVPRIALMHKMEREGKLPDLHQQCSYSPTEPIEDNRLNCCLGVECRTCPELLFLGDGNLSPEELDIARAWTCAAHIVSYTKRRIDTSEGYLLTRGDQMYCSTVYENLSSYMREEEEEKD